MRVKGEMILQLLDERGAEVSSILFVLLNEIEVPDPAIQIGASLWFPEEDSGDSSPLGYNAIIEEVSFHTQTGDVTLYFDAVGVPRGSAAVEDWIARLERYGFVRWTPPGADTVAQAV